VSARSGRLETLAVVLAGLATSLPAQPPEPCEVPADFSTVQVAVSDPACAEVVIAAGSYDESVVVARTLTIAGAGAGSTRLGRPFVVAGAGTALTLAGLAIDVGGGCYRAPLVVKDGATLVVAPAAAVRVRADSLPSEPCPLFDDGFESGTSHAWSATAP
jgi:hypothetical protein